MKTRPSVLAGALAFGASLVASAPASALLLELVTAEIGSQGANDCKGLFGNPSGTTPGTICDVGHALKDENGQAAPQDISPIIAKYDLDEKEWTVNSSFTTVDGDVEFDFTNAGGTPASGSWTYTQSSGDPDVRYWVAKGGNQGFLLHWMVAPSELEVGGACAGTEKYTSACLLKAAAVNSGSWATAAGGLSHLTWYDTGPGGDPNVNPNPEPGMLFLMGAGLLGLGMARRRKSA